MIGALVSTAVLLLGACTSDDSSDSTSGTTVPALPSDAQAIVDSTPYDFGTWHYVATDLETGEVVWSEGADQLNFLASTTKLFTGGAYLDTFGPDSTLETPVYATVAPVDGRLGGDLVLVGAGDILMGSRNVLDGDLQWEVPDHVYAYATPLATQVEADPLAGLDQLAAEVVASGITTVEGDVLVDERLWEPFVTKEGVLTPIMVNDNLLDMIVTPGAAAGDPAAIAVRPATAYFEVDNQVTTTAAGGDAAVTVEVEGNTIVLEGEVALDSDPYGAAAFAPDPGAYARALFIEALQRAGVTVTAPLTAPTSALPAEGSYTEAAKVASLTSPPATVFNTLVQKISHNRGAETMLCLMAVEAGSKDCSDGLATINESVDRAGIAPRQVFIIDGEGTDPSSATPTAVVEYLTWASTQSWANVYEEALPDVAEDGTIYAKSGTSVTAQAPPLPALFVAQAEAGYMTTASGRRLAVAVYALNGSFPTLPEGLQQSGKNTKDVLKDMQASG